MCYPLATYSRHDGKKVKQEYEKLVTTLKLEHNRWTHYLDIRSTLKDFFKLVKDALSLQRLHRYSRSSVLKFVCIDELFAGMIILTGFNSKKQLQALAEW